MWACVIDPALTASATCDEKEQLPEPWYLATKKSARDAARVRSSGLQVAPSESRNEYQEPVQKGNYKIAAAVALTYTK
jgi:hypothetical protein